MSSVRLEGVTKAFKEMIAVDNIDLEVMEGEFLSFLGPSGCGKTTTLRMIGGFEQPTSGKVFLGEDNVAGLPPYKRNVNTVFQSYALFPHLSVSENVAYGLKRKKVSKDEIKTRVKDILDLVDLPGYEDRRITQMSGGQQQRVALARALVNRPGVLLLDEPLGALDLKLRKQMQLELKRIQSEVGITFIYVTHDQEEAMTMSDRIAVMNAGHFEQIGAPQDMYELPATEFVASFLGASNLLDGVARGPGRRVSSRETRCRINGFHPRRQDAYRARRGSGRGQAREDPYRKQGFVERSASQLDRGSGHDLDVHRGQHLVRMPHQRWLQGRRVRAEPGQRRPTVRSRGCCAPLLGSRAHIRSWRARR